MESSRAQGLKSKIQELQMLMIEYATNGRTPEQPKAYLNLYIDVLLELEEGKYANPNPHKSLEGFWAFCKHQEMTTYASRRAYVQELYADIFLDLQRIQRHVASSKSWKKANEALSDDLTPIRTQWLKAKNFIYSPTPDFENSVKESINSIESCLMVLLNQPNGTLGKIIKDAKLDPDVERLVSQAYGLVSNKDFVRHGGVSYSTLGKEEAEYFLDFAASCIVYIKAKAKRD